jgi:hypothetical protein
VCAASDTKSSTRHTLFDAPSEVRLQDGGRPVGSERVGDPQKQVAGRAVLAQGAKVILPTSSRHRHPDHEPGVSRGAREVIDYDRPVGQQGVVLRPV